MKVKVLNVNVWEGGILLDSVIDFLKKEDADIVLLQEVFDNSDSTLPAQYRTFEELKKRLKYEYALFAPNMIDDVDGKDLVQGNAVLSMFPLSPISIVHYDVPFGKRINSREHFHVSPRSLQCVTADMNGTLLHVFNTQGIWGENGDDTERRLQMSQRIMEEVGDKSPVILAGDFNVQEGTKTILHIEEKLKNVFYRELKTSFNVTRKDLQRDPGFATSTVDMMFVSPEVKVLSKSAPNIDVSDHLPLIAELEIT